MRALLILVLVFPLAAWAETGPLLFGAAGFTRELESDRPDFTEGTQTIEAGHLQVEAGYTYLEDSAQGLRTEEQSWPELLLRVGLDSDLELRLAWEGYLTSGDNTPENSDLEGLSDMSVGFKKMFFTGENLNLSSIVELGLPVGEKPFSSEGVEPAVKFLWAHDLTSELGLAGNINAASLDGESERYLQIASSLSLATALTSQLGSYLEYFGFYPTETVPENTEHYLNGGLTFLALEDLQFDVRVGFGLNDSADDFFTGSGIVWRH